MIGNVWEWTKEVYSPNRQYLSSNSATNEPYVIKGGSFFYARLIIAFATVQQHANRRKLA